MLNHAWGGFLSQGMALEARPRNFRGKQARAGAWERGKASQMLVSGSASTRNQTSEFSWKAVQAWWVGQGVEEMLSHARGSSLSQGTVLEARPLNFRGKQAGLVRRTGGKQARRWWVGRQASQDRCRRRILERWSGMVGVVAESWSRGQAVVDEWNRTSHLTRSTAERGWADFQKKVHWNFAEKSIRLSRKSSLLFPRKMTLHFCRRSAMHISSKRSLHFSRKRTLQCSWERSLQFFRKRSLQCS